MEDRLFNAMAQRARQALRRRDMEEAERLVSRLMESYPADAVSNGLKLELLLANGRVQEAERLSEILVARFPSSAGILFHAGMAAHQLKKHKKALALFEESEKNYPALKTRRWIGKTLTNIGRFDDAESLLVNVYEQDPTAATDLAWLYERKGDTARAKYYVDKHLKRFPKDKMAQSQMVRLRGSELDGSDILEQIEALDAMGEPVPDELAAKYADALVAAGRGEEARRFIQNESARLRPQARLDLAWTCFRLQMHDLAYDLFVSHLENRLNDVKFLNSLEFSAKRAGKTEELALLFETLGPRQPKLFGRAKKLKA